MRRANREPLSEVQALNEKLFFTRSIRKSRNGFIVFILDKNAEVIWYLVQVHPLRISREYADDQKADSFADASDEYFAASPDGNATDNIKVTEISISRKGAQSVVPHMIPDPEKLSLNWETCKAKEKRSLIGTRMRMRPISTWRERKYLMSKSMG